MITIAEHCKIGFYNIFNEWYAAQTSKKIRAVWASKSAHGERVSAVVAFGYKKDSEYRLYGQFQIHYGQFQGSQNHL